MGGGAGVVVEAAQEAVMVTDLLVDLRRLARDQQRNRNKGAHNRHSGPTPIGTLKKRKRRRLTRRGLHALVVGQE